MNKEVMKRMIPVLLLAGSLGCSSAAAGSTASVKEAPASSAESETAEAAPETEQVAGISSTEINGALEQEEIELPEVHFSRAAQIPVVKVNVYDRDFTMPFDAKDLTSMPGIKVTQSADDVLINNSYVDDGYCTLSVTIDKNNKVTRISDNQSNYWGIMTENGLRRGMSEKDVTDTLTKQGVKYEKEAFNTELWMYYYVAENDDDEYTQAAYTYTCGTNGVYAVDVTLMKTDEYYFTAEELSGLAANYCYCDGAKAWAPYYNMTINLDGTFSIQLYEETDGHTATWAWYKVNRMGKGIDLMTNKEVDFLKYVQ